MKNAQHFGYQVVRGPMHEFLSTSQNHARLKNMSTKQGSPSEEEIRSTDFSTCQYFKLQSRATKKLTGSRKKRISRRRLPKSKLIDFLSVTNLLFYDRGHGIQGKSVTGIVFKVRTEGPCQHVQALQGNKPVTGLYFTLNRVLPYRTRQINWKDMFQTYTAGFFLRQ